MLPFHGVRGRCRRRLTRTCRRWRPWVRRNDERPRRRAALLRFVHSAGRRAIKGAAVRPERRRGAKRRWSSDKRASPLASSSRPLRTTCERGLRSGADDRNRWTKRARVPRRFGLLLVVQSARDLDDGYEFRMALPKA